MDVCGRYIQIYIYIYLKINIAHGLFQPAIVWGPHRSRVTFPTVLFPSAPRQPLKHGLSMLGCVRGQDPPIHFWALWFRSSAAGLDEAETKRQVPNDHGKVP